MEMMKKILLALTVLISAPLLRAQQVTYSLPRTVIVVEVDAVREVSFAGPYAAYAKQMLGIDARQKDEYRTRISQIRTYTKVEADHQRRFVASGKAAQDLLTLSPLGLVSMGPQGDASSASWTFSGADSTPDFSTKGLTSQQTTIQQTVYKEVLTDTSITRIAVLEDVVVDKSLEQKAREAAEKILRARDERFKITIGDTDATFSGEALGSAIAELDRVEKEYLTLFTGYTVTAEESRSFDVIPVKGTESYDVFRLSDSEGILAPDAKAGKPYYLDVIPAPIAPVQGEDAAKAAKPGGLVYRIPAVCSVTLGTGTTPLIMTRFPVSQLGEESTYITK